METCFEIAHASMSCGLTSLYLDAFNEVFQSSDRNFLHLFKADDLVAANARVFALFDKSLNGSDLLCACHTVADGIGHIHLQGVVTPLEQRGRGHASTLVALVRIWHDHRDQPLMRCVVRVMPNGEINRKAQRSFMAAGFNPAGPLVDCSVSDHYANRHLSASSLDGKYQVLPMIADRATIHIAETLAEPLNLGGDADV